MGNSPNVVDLQALIECVRTHASGLIASALTIIGAASVVYRVLASEVAGIKSEGILGRVAHWIGVLGLNKK